MRENVLNGIGKLEGINIAKSELDVRIDHELCQAKNFAAQVEGISETRFLAFLGSQSLDGLQVHVLFE